MRDKRIRPSCWAVMAGMAAVPMKGFADLIEYRYDTHDGTEVVAGAEERYAAPASDLTFALSGGLERRLLIRIKDSSGDVVSEQLTRQIGPDDRISVDGRSYYGLRVPLAPPSEDGLYTVQHAITDDAGAALESTSYSVFFDVQAPFEPEEPADVAWENDTPWPSEFHGFLRIDDGPPQPLSYSPTNFSEADYAYAQASATGLLQLQDKAWVKLSMQNGMLYLIQVLDKQNDPSGGRYQAAYDGLPENTRVVVSDDHGEVRLDRYPQARWYWWDCCTDGGVLGIPFNEEEKLEFTATFSGAENIEELIVFNNDGNPYTLDNPNRTISFELGGDLTSLKLDRWSYFEENKAEPYYRAQVRGINIGDAASWELRQAQLQLIDAQGEVAGTAPAQVVNHDGTAYELMFHPHEAAPNSGTYGVRLSIEDSLGQHELFELEERSFDTTPPSITVLKEGEPFSEGEVTSLDQLSLAIEDDLDPNAAPTAIRLTGGPAQEDVYLAASRVNGRYKLEYPVMFPSLSPADRYTLEVVAQDAQGNRAGQGVAFSYTPAQVALEGNEKGKITIPAVIHEFTHADGSRFVKTEPLTLSDGTTVSGNYDVFATLRSDAALPLIVAGTRLEPGDTVNVMSNHDFASSGGRISVPVMPAENGLEGMASLLISTTAPNAPIVTVNVETWAGGADLNADSWEVRQVIDQIDIQATPSEGTHCRITASESEARAADPITDPVCYLQWEAVPDETAVLPNSREPRIAGQAIALGQQQVGYSLWIYDTDGTSFRVGEGEKALNVVPAWGAVAYAPSDDLSEVGRSVQGLDVRLRQQVGPDCQLTLSREEAISYAAQRALRGGSRLCWFEWTGIPEGLTQLDGQDTPTLRGTLGTNGEHTLAWRVSTFSQTGEEVTLAEQTETITVVDPESPSVTMTADNQLDDGLFTVPVDKTYLGEVVVEGIPTAIDLTVVRDGQAISEETHPTRPGRPNHLTQRLYADQRELWSETVHQVTARYTKAPDVATTQSILTVATPPNGITPVVQVDGEKVLDTQPLPVTVAIENPDAEEPGYQPEQMGEWEVRLLDQATLSTLEPLTDFQPATGGTASFDLDLAAHGNASLRLMAEARLISPLEGYERVEQARPVFIEVLRGGAIAGEVSSRQLSGHAPLTTLFRLDLEDRMNQQATGAVVWQVSDDGGASWTTHEPDERRKMQFHQTFGEGAYQVRAKITNRHSGETTYTEAVPVTAYHTPEIDIEGPPVLFVGDGHTYV